MKYSASFVTSLVSLMGILSAGCGTKDATKKSDAAATAGSDQNLEQARTDKSAEQVSGQTGNGGAAQKRLCGLSLDVTTTGGTFIPEVCQFEKVSGGPECRNPDLCKADNVIVLSAKGYTPGQINRVALFHIRDFASGTYKFDGGAARDFDGALTQMGGLMRNLVQGSVTLEVRGKDRVQVSFDAVFDAGITVQGSGLLEVKKVAAP